MKNIILILGVILVSCNLLSQETEWIVVEEQDTLMTNSLKEKSDTIQNDSICEYDMLKQLIKDANNARLRQVTKVKIENSSLDVRQKHELYVQLQEKTPINSKKKSKKKKK